MSLINKDFVLGKSPIENGAITMHDLQFITDPLNIYKVTIPWQRVVNDKWLLNILKKSSTGSVRDKTSPNTQNLSSDIQQTVVYSPYVFKERNELIVVLALSFHVSRFADVNRMNDSPFTKKVAPAHAVMSFKEAYNKIWNSDKTYKALHPTITSGLGGSLVFRNMDRDVKDITIYLVPFYHGFSKPAGDDFSHLKLRKEMAKQVYEQVQKYVHNLSL